MEVLIALIFSLRQEAKSLSDTEDKGSDAGDLKRKKVKKVVLISGRNKGLETQYDYLTIKAHSTNVVMN